MFQELQPAPQDPILGLTEAFKEDPNPNKINLSVGVYKDNEGATPILSTVKRVERELIKAEDSKTYLPMTGSPEYAKAVQSLLFGQESEIVGAKRAVTAQTPGGTGSLRVAGDFIRMIRPDATLWVSDPTWANHIGIFEAAGLTVKSYPYYNAAKKRIDYRGMVAAIRRMEEGDFVLIHGCCHNPTGIDPTRIQWQKIADAIADQKVIPVIDFAYQGLAKNLDADAEGVRLLSGPGREAMICSSFSKNLGMYNERVGALTLVAATAESAQLAFGHVKLAIRRNYSNPPAHGALVAARIINDPYLRKKWEREVGRIRSRIRKMRRLLVQKLKDKGVEQDFSFIKKQNGMFSFSGLTPEQVQTLKDKYSIYIVNSGRINVAAITPDNIDRLVDAIAEVL